MKPTVEVILDFAPPLVEANLTAKRKDISVDFNGIPAARNRYDGEYTVTPTEETQVLQTAGLVMAQDVTVDPIPRNYGLITWDGSKIRVS